MQQRLKILILELTHDKKRFGAMCTLIAFGVLLWARLIILQNLPKTGFADPATDDPATNTDNPSQATPIAPGNSTQKLAELPVTYLDTENDLARNFFDRLTMESAQSEDSTPDTLVAPKSQTKETEISNAADPNSYQAVQKAAEALSLDSVMGGRRPMAVINGSVLGLGQTIDGFTLEAVADNTVTLQRGEFRVELKIK